MSARRDRWFDESVHGVWPVFNLIYLFFVFLPLLFLPAIPPRTLWLTLAAVALFLPIYAAGYRAAGRVRVLACPAMAAIGFALIPINPGGTSFLLYAMGHAADCLPAGVALVVAAVIAVAVGVEITWFGYHWANLAITVVIGAVIVFGVLFARASQRRTAELRLGQDEVKRLARVNERERIGRDLHDVLGHTLSLVAIKSELAGKLFDRDPGAARAEIADVERVAREALGEVRRAVAGMRAPGLEAELARARLALSSREVSLDGALEPLALGAEAESALALGLREAVTNVLRHARARRVEVALRGADGWAVLEIADDGRGGPIRDGHGLGGMRERLEALGGDLSIEADSGTRLRLRVPLAGGAAA
jgi:two-component system sensor histidine kinase DesK